MATDPSASPGKTLLLMAVFVIVGLPMVAYLWEALNDVLALKFDPVRVLIFGFWAMMYLMLLDR